MEKITLENEKNDVSSQVIIPFIEGDGIGKEIWQASYPVIDAAVNKAYQGAKKIVWQEVLAGVKAFETKGEWLPSETLTAIQEAKIALKGPLTTPVGGGIRSLNVALRQELDLFACVRPVRYFKGIPSPLKTPEKTNMIIFRENTEDVYAGIEFEKDSSEVKELIQFLKTQFGVSKIRFPKTSAIGIKPISKEGSERLISAAIEYAISQKLPSVTLVHKGNIMKFTEGGFKKWGYKLAETKYADSCFTMNQYQEILAQKGKKAAENALATAKKTKIIVNDVIADNFLQQILLNPTKFSVIATCNLNGDYISDALAAQVGGIGIAPGANINYNTGHAIFEATHGTAPDIAGLGKANPCSLLLSAVMLLDYLNWTEAGALITGAIEKALADGFVTADFAAMLPNATLKTTKEFGNYLKEIIEK
ncbi:NADP-dependent isocitrate dehydrogenase [Enterococcus dispar]|uniref:NADP-dependent isocitrate dehydrogenase n=1 Tax=Enterococcus dispar TaxID=44009 RepID=UPI0028913F8F|nr:NADP-dependent isocitrate dehydrogenase [Enterococcus dispar]MDT2704532.1 NADP-dependent isocitrate dehydrogenase [Enterococcus dispar]